MYDRKLIDYKPSLNIIINKKISKHSNNETIQIKPIKPNTHYFGNNDCFSIQYHFVNEV